MPTERLLALALGQGPTGTPLDLRHERRSAAAAMDELGRLLGNLCRAVPQVAFPARLHPLCHCALIYAVFGCALPWNVGALPNMLQRLLLSLMLPRPTFPTGPSHHLPNHVKT